jgi:GR25 family glycosyltransferase involved in LPS biosynthesis
MESIKGFIIHSVHEPARAAHVESILNQFIHIKRIEAIYPSQQKVPFLAEIIKCSINRTGKALTHGEIGVLLTNRWIWQQIVQNATDEQEHFLILESDSLIKEPSLLAKDFKTLTNAYDLFYFGGWLGHIQLFRSARKKWADHFLVGEPYIKTLCSGYGYALNKRAAALMLARTKKVGYAFDEVRRYLQQDELKLGAVVPEWITQKPGESMIGKRPSIWVSDAIWRTLLDLRNWIICYFK